MLQKIKRFLDAKTNIIAGMILSVMFLLMIASSEGDSLTRDELAHIVAGYSYLTQHDYRLNPEHPPLIKDLSAVPLLFINPEFPAADPAWTRDINGQWSLGDTFLFKIGNDADKIIFWARLPIMLLALLGGLYVFRLARELSRSAAASLLALTLYAFSPNIIAHSRLVTTDLGIAVFMLISFYHFRRFLASPTWKNLLVMSAVFGLTHLTKFSSPLLLPVFGLMIAASSFSRTAPKETSEEIKLPLTDKLKYDFLKKLYNYTAGFILISALAYLMVGGYYSFHIKNMPLVSQHQLINDAFNSKQYQPVRETLNKMTDIPVLRPYSQYALGFFMVFAHSTGGHTTFFMSENGKHWWNYYLVAYLIKEPIPSQLLLYLAAGIALWQIAAKNFFLKRSRTLAQTLSASIKNLLAWAGRYYMELGMTAFTIMLLATGATSKLQLGIRYILPAFPLIYILIAVVLKRFLSRLKNRLFLPYYYAFFAFALLWLAMETFTIFPSYLAYYNEFIGGPKNGYNYLVDSNTDWGQDLKRLAKFADDNKIAKIKVDYFGGADPAYYLKDKYVPWGFDKGPTTGWLAVGASSLQWNRGLPEDRKIKAPEYNYHWLDAYEPVAQIGYSIFVYNIE